MGANNIVLSYYAIKAETDKSRKVSINYDIKGGDSCFTSWIPKSISTINEYEKTITIPYWLYLKNKV